MIPKIGLFILADGMGGARGGGFASRLAADTVAGLMQDGQKPDASTLMAAVEEAHQRIRAESISDPALNGMGTTLIAALIQEGEVAIVSVGDSRAYRFGGGKLELLTEDQTWVKEVGIPLGLNEAALRMHPMRHALTMAIGIDADLESRYYVATLEPGYGVLLSSDGLHGLVKENEILEIVCRPGAPIQKRCEELVRAAHKAGGTDNITAIICEAI